MKTLVKLFAFVAVLGAPSAFAIPPSQGGPIAQVEESRDGTTWYYVSSGNAAEFGRTFAPTVVGSTSAALTLRLTSGSDMFGSGDTLIATLPAITSGGADFVLDTTGFNTTGLAVGASTSFTLLFAPLSTGTKSATVEFSYNAFSGPATYSINFSGQGVAAPVPVLRVYEDTGTGLLPLYENTSAWMPATTGRNFGSRVINGDPTAPVLIVVANEGATGAGDLTLGLPVLFGGNMGHVLDTTGFSTTLSQGISTSFTVVFQPTSTGVPPVDYGISFTHNDSTTTSPFPIRVAGSGLDEALRLRVSDVAPTWSPSLLGAPYPDEYTGVYIADNAAASGKRAMPQTAIGQTRSLTMHVANAGWGAEDIFGVYYPAPDLALGVPVIVSGDVADFTVETTSMAATLTEGTSTSFIIRFTPQTVGAKSAVIEFSHDDQSLRTPFRVNVTGAAVVDAGTSPKPEATCALIAVAQGNGTMPLMFALLVAGVAARCMRRSRASARK